MKDHIRKMREVVTEWEDIEAAQLASAQHIHFEGPQISQRYVSQCAQHETAASVHSVGERSNRDEVQMKIPNWSGDIKHFSFNLLVTFLACLMRIFVGSKNCSHIYQPTEELLTLYGADRFSHA